MIHQHVAPVLIGLAVLPGHFALTLELTECRHRVPLFLRLGSLYDKCNIGFALTDHLRLAYSLWLLEFTLYELTDTARVEVEGVPVPHLELVFVKEVRVVCHLANFVANLGILGIFVPLS